MSTKAHGNLVDVTLFGEVDSAGRRLNNNMCFATISMDREARDQTYLDFLASNPIRYITTADGKNDTGVVNFIDSPWEMAFEDVEAAEFEVPDSLIAYFENLEEGGGLERLLAGKDIETLVMYAEVECEDRRCPTLGAHSVFFMYCGGTPDQAMFDTGNCCLVGQAQLDGNQDMRRLGKCDI